MDSSTVLARAAVFPEVLRMNRSMAYVSAGSIRLLGSGVLVTLVTLGFAARNATTVSLGLKTIVWAAMAVSLRLIVTDQDAPVNKR